jgi:serine/threonine protein kinase
MAADSHSATIQPRVFRAGEGRPTDPWWKRKRCPWGFDFRETRGARLSQSTSETNERPPIGPYRFVRPLEPGRLAPRWLAVHDRDHTSHIAHEFACRDRAEQRRFLSAFEAVAELEHPHILPVEQFAFADRHIAWLITPYTGNQEGLLSLASLLDAKGGRMSADEAERAIGQILSAMEYAHGRGELHGLMAADEVLVDRRGRISIELYGLARRLNGLTAGNSEVVRDEVRSVVEMGYRLLTGLSPEEPRIPAGRLADRLSPAWDRWLEEGLDALTGGFSSASVAKAALPSAQRDQRPPVTSVRRVLGRVRAALRQSP